ncbi:MAG: type IV pili methyl-accepting chemotaxis transducer N-terminal domain-containing protein [Pseudomonadota bacterium]
MTPHFPSKASLAFKAPALLASALLAFAFTPAAAEGPMNVGARSYYEMDDGNQRINLSGRLRMLSQRIPGMACNNAAGIEAAKSQANLSAAVEEFSVILAGLQVGDPELQIFGPEESRRVLGGIIQLRERWEPFQELAIDVLDGDAAAVAVDELAAHSLPLLTDAQVLVGRIVERHYDRVLTIQSETFTIDFAGRQRMLAQQMSKNICLLHSDGATDAALEELKKGYTLFDATLNALQVGMPEVGVSAPPNRTVEEGLQVVADAWEDLTPTLERAMAGEQFDEATRIQLFHDLNALTAKMNEAVKMYVSASALGSA